MEERPLDVVGTGSMVLDTIYRTPRIIGAEAKALLQPHEDGRVVHRLVGGVTLNHLGWARLLGLHVGIFGKQGDDAAGRLLREGMDALGIERQIDRSGTASSCAQIFVAPDGGRAIYMLRGATGELTPDDVDGRYASMIARARIVTTEISQVPLPTVRRVLERARDAGATTVLDLDVPLSDAVPALGTQAELHACLSLADVLKPSLAAVGGIVPSGTPEQVARALAERFGTRTVAVTLGAEGALIWSEGAATAAPTPSVRVLDTTGAGDAFLGGFVAGLHLGLDTAGCARLGTACGAACCERLGGYPDHPGACLSRVLELYQTLGGAAFAPPDRPDTAVADRALDAFLATASAEVASAAAAADRDALRAAAQLVTSAEARGGRVHVTGIGKPEHVAHYVASLLSSTGTPATFLHGTEATHGSSGQVVGRVPKLNAWAE